MQLRNMSLNVAVEWVFSPVVISMYYCLVLGGGWGGGEKWGGEEEWEIGSLYQPHTTGQSSLRQCNFPSASSLGLSANYWLITPELDCGNLKLVLLFLLCLIVSSLNSRKEINLGKALNWMFPFWTHDSFAVRSKAELDAGRLGPPLPTDPGSFRLVQPLGNSRTIWLVPGSGSLGCHWQLIYS